MLQLKIIPVLDKFYVRESSNLQNSPRTPKELVRYTKEHNGQSDKKTGHF